MNASSSLDDVDAPGRREHAIFNNKQGSWCAYYYNRINEWLELDLGSNQTIYGVAVQGAHDSDSEVTKYIISIRVDGAPEGTWLVEAVCSLNLLILKGDRVEDVNWYQKTLKKYWEVTCDVLASQSGGVAILKLPPRKFYCFVQGPVHTNHDKFKYAVLPLKQKIYFPSTQSFSCRFQ